MLVEKRFVGRGLHTGAPCTVIARRRPGPLCFVHRGTRLERAALRVTRTDYGVRVVHPETRFELELVEHLFAALGGLGIQTHLELEVDGPELPLLDGCALGFARGLVELEIPTSAPALVVRRAAELLEGDARYRFEPAPQPELRVEVEFRGIGNQAATWDGRATSFVRDIAPARTFGFVADAQRLFSAERARGVDPSVVLVLCEDGSALPPAGPPLPAELARHKLLDLIGDSYLYGGPPRGKLSATRPGHTATHRVIQRALAEGILELDPWPQAP